MDSEVVTSRRLLTSRYKRDRELKPAGKCKGKPCSDNRPWDVRALAHSNRGSARCEQLPTQLPEQLLQRQGQEPNSEKEHFISF